MARILAMDFGAKRTGIAVTDPLQIISTTLTTVNTSELLTFLKDYVAKEPVCLFVIGEPKHKDGNPMEVSNLIEMFIKRLILTFPDIPIEREDERYTSKLAFQTMIDSGIGKEKRKDKKLVDKIAAVLILQSYLQRKSLQ